MKKKPMSLFDIPISTANLIYSISFIALLVGAAVVLISAAALVWSSSIRDRQATERIARLDAANAQAVDATRKAEAEAAEATRLLAQANATAAAAQKDAAEAKAAKVQGTPSPVGGRKVTLDNRALFIDFVKTVSKGRVVIESIASDSEATNFARQISDMLQGAGYTVDENFGSPVLLGSPPIGVEMQIRSTEEQPVYAGALQRGLEFVGIPTTGALDNGAGDMVVLFIGTKP